MVGTTSSMPGAALEHKNPRPGDAGEQQRMQDSSSSGCRTAAAEDAGEQRMQESSGCRTAEDAGQQQWMQKSSSRGCRTVEDAGEQQWMQLLPGHAWPHHSQHRQAGSCQNPCWAAHLGVVQSQPQAPPLLVLQQQSLGWASELNLDPLHIYFTVITRKINRSR